MHILFVCTGNTCRSPMAEGICKDISQKKGFKISCRSAGLFAIEGQKVSLNAVGAMEEKGIDISNHQPQNLDKKALKKADIIVPMTPEHGQSIINTYPEFKNKVKYLTKPIADPYGEDLKTYKNTASELNKLITSLIDNLYK